MTVAAMLPRQRVTGPALIDIAAIAIAIHRSRPYVQRLVAAHQLRPVAYDKPPIGRPRMLFDPNDVAQLVRDTPGILGPSLTRG